MPSGRPCKPSVLREYERNRLSARPIEASTYAVPEDIGIDGCFDFTDGAPDSIDGVSIQAGNLIVR
jgi:hypothetical protein